MKKPLALVRLPILKVLRLPRALRLSRASRLSGLEIGPGVDQMPRVTGRALVLPMLSRGLRLPLPLLTGVRRLLRRRWPLLTLAGVVLLVDLALITSDAVFRPPWEMAKTRQPAVQQSAESSNPRADGPTYLNGEMVGPGTAGAGLIAAPPSGIRVEGRRLPTSPALAPSGSTTAPAPGETLYQDGEEISPQVTVRLEERALISGATAPVASQPPASSGAGTGAGAGNAGNRNEAAIGVNSGAPVSPEEMLSPVPEAARGIINRFGLGFSRDFDDYRFHPGVDLAASENTPVRAVLPGRVSLLAYDRNGGYQVTIYHGAGLETYYSQLATVQVVHGAEVEAGAVIGRVGRPGLGEASLGPHLHFEVRRQGRPVDPAPFLR